MDILIADSLPVETLLPIWRRHRKRFPYVSSYTCRTIVFGDADIQRLKSLAEGIKTTINVIDLKDSERDLSELIITLSLPGNDVIDGIKIG